MNRRFKAVNAALLAGMLSASLFAADQKAPKDTKERKTVIVKDGQVFLGDGESFSFAAPFFQRSYIGVNLMNLSPELRAHFGSGDRGSLISTVASDSPAERAGLKVGDVITTVDGQKISGAGDVSKAIREKKAGDSIRIDFIRGGAPQHTFVTVAEREPRKIELGEMITPEMIRARDLSVETAEKLGEYFRSPEWKARIEQFQDCGRVQTRVQELESRLKELEKRLDQ